MVEVCLTERRRQNLAAWSRRSARGESGNVTQGALEGVFGVEPVLGGIHELTELHPGQLLQLASIEHPKGGTPAWAEAYILCRRP
jgi:hypothetical protein